MNKTGYSIRRLSVAACLALMLVSLTGCSGIIEERPLGSVDPGAIKPGTSAPVMDGQVQGEEKASVYSVDPKAGSLKAAVVDVRTVGGRIDLQDLLARQMDLVLEAAGQSADGIPDRRNAGFELTVSGQSAVVNLSNGFRAFEPELLYDIRQSVAQTLCLAGCRTVGVLIDGREEGVDLAGLVPAGAFTRIPPDELAVRYAQSADLRQTLASFTLPTTFFLPSPDAAFILPYTCDVTYEKAGGVEYLYSILETLSRLAGTPGFHSYPAPLEYMDEMPEIVRSEEDEYRVISLRFSEGIRSALKDAGVSLQLYLGMLTNTFMGFIPGMDGVRVSIGGSSLTALNRLQTVDGTSRSFADGRMDWSTFEALIGAPETLYLPSAGGGLRKETATIPAGRSGDPRTVLSALIAAWAQDHERLGGLEPDDILAVRVEKSDIVINFSARLETALGSMSDGEQTAFLYAVVNTITENRPQKSVVFFFGGKQIDGGTTVLRGRVYRNPGIIRP